MPAVWRNTQVEAIFEGLIDETLDEVAMGRVIGQREGQHIEFKKPGAYGPTRGSQRWTEEQEFTKDVSAFANQSGGVVIVGVDEQSGIASGLVPITGVDPEPEERRLRQALSNNQEPLANIDFLSIPASSGGWYLVVVVPPSAKAPHAVVDRGDGRRPLCYPIRRGPDTEWLTEPEVAELYRLRAEGVQERRARADAVVADGLSSLARTSRLWLWVAFVPDFVIYSPVSATEVQAAQDWFHHSALAAPLGSTIGAYGRAIPAPGRVTFVQSRQTDEEEEAQPQTSLVELGVDGSSFAAMLLNAADDEDDVARLVPEFETLEDAILLVDLCLRWTLERVGSWGSATLRIGVVDPSRDAPDQALEYASHDGRCWRRAGPRLARDWPHATTAVDLAAVDTMQRRLAVVHQVLSKLLNWFGLAEPPQIKRDGSLVSRQWLVSNSRAVEQWADAHDVECERIPGR